MNESQIFAEALKRATPSERSGYLDQACAGHPQLRADVEALLRAQQDNPDFLEQPAGPLEKTVVTGPPVGPPADQPVVSELLHDLEGPGSVLGGRYKLYEQIGEGGMGTVWMALQSVPVRRQVAVKLIKAGMDSRQVIARFEAERQALALMDHPSIAKVLDAGTTAGGRPYFVMELVKGIPLTKYCDDNRLPLRERLELFIPVCQAIQHAHQKGIIHRDIKPSNVLVCLYDGRPVPKVIDFGVAKATGQQLTEQTLVTGFGAVVGTLEYMSPEQAEVNQLDIDTRSDIYSLGVLLYELLTGTTPLDRKRFKQAAIFELLRLIREVDPPRPSTRLSESRDSLPSISAQRKSEPARLTTLVRGELDWIVMKALEKDRNRRYETANSFLQDVQRYLVDEPVQACPPSTAYRFRKFVRRNRAGLTAGTLVALALLVGLLVSSWQAVRATKAEGVAQEERSKAEGLAKTEAEAHVLASERAKDLARQLYIQRVNLGYREALANNVAQADALLEACEPDRRGWEWALSKRLCHLETMTLGGFADHAAAVAAARRGPIPPETGDAEFDKAVGALMAVAGNVRSVACSPDGRQIVAAHDDGTVGIYDSRTGREIRSLAGHEGCASCVTFDADGGRVISGGFDRTIRVWDAKTGEQKLILRGHTRPVLSIAFRPGTDELASSAHGAWATFWGDGFEIKQWDLAQGREIRTLHHGHGWSHTSVAFSSDGRRLLSTAVWGQFLRLWDADTGKVLEERRIPENSPGLAVSPADGRVAYGGADNLLWVGSPELGTDMQKCSGHTAQVVGAAFSPDGSRVASASEDGTIRVWNVADGREMTLLRGHTAGVNSVAFHRDGNTLVSCGEDGTIKCWDLSLAPDPFPISYPVWAHRARFSPDGKRTAIVRFSVVSVMDSTTMQAIYEVPIPGDINHLTYSRDARLIAFSSTDSHRTSVRDAETGQPVATCPEAAGHLCSLAFGSGSMLAVAADDGTILFWDAATGSAGSVIQVGAGGVRGMTFDPSGKTLATIGSDCAVRLWDVATGRLVCQPGPASGRLALYATDPLAFDPEGRRLAATRGDGTVVIWDVATNAEVFTLRGHTRAMNAAAYSPDGRRIATASDDFTIKLWDAANGDEVFTLRGHTGFVIGLGFSPDGNRLLSASADGTVRSWNATPRSN